MHYPSGSAQSLNHTGFLGAADGMSHGPMMSQHVAHTTFLPLTSTLTWRIYNTPHAPMAELGYNTPHGAMGLLPPQYRYGYQYVHCVHVHIHQYLCDFIFKITIIPCSIRRRYRYIQYMYVTQCAFITFSLHSFPFLPSSLFPLSSLPFPSPLSPFLSRQDTILITVV